MPRRLDEPTTWFTCSLQLVSTECSLNWPLQYRRLIAEYTWFRFLFRPSGHATAMINRMMRACNGRGRRRVSKVVKRAGVRVLRLTMIDVQSSERWAISCDGVSTCWLWRQCTPDKATDSLCDCFVDASCPFAALRRRFMRLLYVYVVISVCRNLVFCIVQNKQTFYITNRKSYMTIDYSH